MSVQNVQYQISLRDLLSSTVNRAASNVHNFDNEIDNAISDINRLQKSMGSVSGSNFMQTTGAVALGTMLTSGIQLAGREAVKQVKEILSAGLDVGKLKAEFGVLAGKEGGEMLFGDLTKYIQDSIFGTELYGSTKTLLAFGVAAQDIMPVMKQLGDVAMGDKEKMQSLTLAFGQTQAAGKLMGQDLLQYISAGFNPLKEMERTTGKTYQSLKDLMSEGGISAKMVADAFKSATSEGGLFFGMLNKIGDTPFGKLQAMEGNIMAAKQQLGEALLPAMSDFMDAMRPLVDKLPDMFAALLPTLKNIIGSLSETATWIAKNGEVVEKTASLVKVAAEGYIAWKVGVLALSAANFALAGSTARTTTATIANTSALVAQNTALVTEAELVAALAIEYDALTVSYSGWTAAQKAGLAATLATGASLPINMAGTAAAGAAGARTLMAGAASLVVPVFIAGASIAAGEALGMWKLKSFKDWVPDAILVEMGTSEHSQALRDAYQSRADRKELRENPVQSESLNPLASWDYMAGKPSGYNVGLLDKYGVKMPSKTAASSSSMLKQDIAKVTGQQVRNTYITINGGLIHDFTVKTVNLKDSKPEIKRLVTETLTDAINDSQISNR